MRPSVLRLLAALVAGTGLTLGAVATPASSASGAPTSSPGCGSAVATGVSAYSIRSAGRTRISVIDVPSNLVTTAPAPLVLDLHGSGSTAQGQRLFSGMDAQARRSHFIVDYPQGIIPDSRGFDWNVPHEPLYGGRAVPPGSPSDVTYLTHLVTSIEAHFCVDPREVYATGFSGGARMVSQLACDASGVFAAVAPVSGLRLPSPCPSTRPVPVVSFHGTDDPVDPYTGHGQNYWTYSVPTAAKRWARHDGCQLSPLVSTVVSGVEKTSYTRCQSGASVQLYTITGEGHEWPGGPPMSPVLTGFLGPQSSLINACQVMWEFFASHPLTNA